MVYSRFQEYFILTLITPQSVCRQVQLDVMVVTVLKKSSKKLKQHQYKTILMEATHAFSRLEKTGTFSCKMETLQYSKQIVLERI